ncbi:MAG: hypothetical protein AUK47_22025 [Deltaproteobacteria bacterium CG2_30_63_29]|nr:MAG: hypothetical protein AUK47_22025 [Deltaproteobacteria bacterium CG2_30_63_29]
MRALSGWFWLTFLLLSFGSVSCQAPKEEAESKKESAQADRAPTGAANEQSVANPAPTSVDDELTLRNGEEGAIDDGEFDKEESADESKSVETESSGGQEAFGIAGKTEVEGKDTDTKKDEPPKKTWKRSQLVPNASKLMVGDALELPLEGIQVNADVDGSRARVLVDFYFFNDHDQQFEGDFKLRLPNGASPFFLAFGQTVFEDPKSRQPTFIDETVDSLPAMDEGQILTTRERTWQEPRVARMVQKEKAAQAYADTVRRRVDPALLEWSGAGVFSAKVFPIAPNQLHRVTVGYDLELTWIDDDALFELALPKAPKSRVSISVAALPGVDVKLQPETQYKEGNGRRLYQLDDTTSETLEVRLNGLKSDLLVGTEQEPFFASSFRPELPKMEVASGSRAILLVDTSMSANPDQFNIWLAMMESLLTENRDTLGSFNVLFFNVETHWWKSDFVVNDAASVAELKAYAQGLALEGATDLGAALREAAKPRWSVGDPSTSERWDVFLLSDAAATWGESDASRIASAYEGGNAGALFAYNTGMSGTDRAMLDQLARNSGGAVFAVTGESEVAVAATAHRARPWLIDGMRVEVSSLGQAPQVQGTDLMLAGRPSALFPGQRVTLVGRGALTSGATVRLEFSQGSVKKSIDVPLAHMVFSGLAARAYGQVAVAQLEELGRFATEYAVPYARHFRVTGNSASLLMLETEEDYLRFDIKPEDDWALVQRTQVSALIRDAIAQLGELLGDPRADFLDLLRRIQDTPGTQFAMNIETRKVIEGLPKDAFDVVASMLECKSRLASELGQEHANRLATRDIDYQAFVDEAQRRFDKYGAVDALRALSSLIENNPGDTVLGRDIGYQLLQWGAADHAYHLFRRVAESRPGEPQTYHALALALAQLGQADLAMAFFEVALAGQWDPRFGEFRQIVSLDYLRFLQRVQRQELKLNAAQFAQQRLKELQRDFPIQAADLLVTIAWNTDRTDVDLHVMEPGGEDCYFSNRDTKLGGHLTQDVTQGYGPEMYVMKAAAAGVYDVRVKFFASDANRASARTKVYATVIEGWGSDDEKVTEKVVTLEIGKEMHDLLEVKVVK